MKETLQQINIEELPAFIEGCGISGLLGVGLQIGTTRKGSMRLDIIGPAKKLALDDQSGLDQIEGGDLRFLIDKMVKVSNKLPGDFSAPDLLQIPQFKGACLSNIEFDRNFVANEFMQRVGNLSENQVPVFYGSTAGINFAEVLETSLCAENLRGRGANASVVFDYDGLKSPESSRIFYESIAVLPLLLREKAINFVSEAGEGFIKERLQSTKKLLDRVENLPAVSFVDGLDIFRALGSKLSVGKLLTIARLAGNDPRIFSQNDIPYTANSFFFNSKRAFFDCTVGEMIELNFKPAGFAYYAREAVIGSLGGIVGVPFKLTEAANIYKILLSCNSLFNFSSGDGAIIMPITRNRIQSRVSEKPIDPIVLKFLADEQPEGFSNLVRDFTAQFKVLSPKEAELIGTVDRKYIIEDYFDLGEKDE